MTRGEEVFTILQSKARSTASRTGVPAPTQEYLVRHLLESFLDRLIRSEHGDDFVLKGGILLAVLGRGFPADQLAATICRATFIALLLPFRAASAAMVGRSGFPGTSGRK